MTLTGAALVLILIQLGQSPVPSGPAPRPTLWLIGDSTVHNGNGMGSNGQWGWGEPLIDLFDSAKIQVVNRARGGRSSRTFLTEGLWSAIEAELKPGDFVVMQFGHNDSSPINDDSRARGTIHGVGEEAEEIDNQLTHKHEVVHSYGWYLRVFIEGARAKGAIPIVCSPIPRNSWKEGRVRRTQDTWAGWAKAVAKAEKASFMDLDTLIADHYDKLGEEKVQPLFETDHTHTSRAGAEINARIVADALRHLTDYSFSNYLR